MGLATPSRLDAKALDDPTSFVTQPFYSHIFDSGSGTNGAQGSSNDDPTETYRRDFLNAESLIEAGAIVSRALIQR